MISYLKKGDIIHKEGLKSLIDIVEWQLKFFPAYEHPKLISELNDYRRVLELMGDRETIPYSEVENGI